mgnify:FL=1
MLYLHVLTPIASLAINVITQVMSFRYSRSLGLLKAEYLGFAAGGVNIIVLDFYFFLISEMPANNLTGVFITNLIIYSALGYCYFHFINLGETARRIRILSEIYDSGKAGLTMEEILQRYNAKEILEKRVSRLQNNKQIILKDGKYFIAGTAMLFMAKAIVMMKLILLGKKSEFD